MWGSDMPNVERFCTYRQSLDYVQILPVPHGAREGLDPGRQLRGASTESGDSLPVIGEEQESPPPGRGA